MKIHKPDAFRQLPSCVLIDLDDTLYAYPPAHTAGMEGVRMFARDQLNVALPTFDACFADARTELKRRLGPVAAAHSRLLYFQRTLELAGLATQPLSALQLEQVYWTSFLNAAQLNEQAADFLDDLRIAGIPAVIVTDLTSQIQLRKMLFFGLHRLVDWMVTSEEAGRDKPDPGIFRLALAKIGGVEGPVWMIGDDDEKDIAGAKAALDCVTLHKIANGQPSETAHSVTADATFSSFKAVRRLVGDLQSA